MHLAQLSKLLFLLSFRYQSALYIYFKVNFGVFAGTANIRRSGLKADTAMGWISLWVGL